MPTSFRIDVDHGVVIVKGDGILGAKELAAFVESYTSHIHYRHGTNLLWDLRDARFLIELEEMKALAEHVSALGARGTPRQVAYVVGNEFTQGLTALFPRLGPPHQVDYRTFEDLAQALEWLGLPPDYPATAP